MKMLGCSLMKQDATLERSVSELLYVLSMQTIRQSLPAFSQEGRENLPYCNEFERDLVANREALLCKDYF